MSGAEEPDRQLRRPVPAQPGDRPGGGGHDAHHRGKRRRLVRLGRDRQPERRPERRQGSRRALPLQQLERCLDRHHPGHLGLDERAEEPDRQLRRPVPAQPGDRPGGRGHEPHLGASDGDWYDYGRDGQPERRPERRQRQPASATTSATGRRVPRRRTQPTRSR